MNRTLLGCVLILVAAGLAAGGPQGEDCPPDRPPPDVIEIESSVGVVLFPHDLHAEDMATECNVCHHETDATPL